MRSSNMDKLVFDVGGSAIKYALMDNDARILEKGQEETPKDSLSSFLGVLERIYSKYVGKIDGIAMSLPGTIDSELGKIYAPGALLYNENVNLVEEMRSFTELPIVLENDGKSAALAEVWKGNLKNCDNGIVLVLGSGIGGGIIKDKKLWKGSHLFAGEFSFVMLESDFKMTNIFALKGSTRALIYDVASRKGVHPETLDGHQVFHMVEQKDEDALSALNEMCKYIAMQIFNLQCMIDPEKVLIGGGISKQEIVLIKVREQLELILATLPFDVPKPEIDTCKFYNDSNLIGALYNYLTETAMEVSYE